MKTICHKALATFVCGLAAVTAVQAQDEQDEQDELTVIEELVVIGSRTLGLEDSTSPIMSITQEEFEANPSFTVGDFLVDNITANGGLTTSTEEGTGRGRANGDRSTAVNLWNLGEENSLVLVNGQRVVPSASPSVTAWFNTDINSVLPSIALQRADVLLDGGSAIYGTDAVAGVVNFIPRYGFEGLEFRLQTDVWPESLGDTASNAFEGLFGTGFGDGRGSFVAAFEYRKATATPVTDLGLNSTDTPQFTGNETPADFEELLAVGTTRGPQAVHNYGVGSRRTGVTQLTDPLCGRHDLVDAPYYVVGEVVPEGALNAGSCGAYGQPEIYLRDSDRYTLFTSLGYEFSAMVSGSLDASYSDREIVDLNRFNTLAGGDLSLATYNMPHNHPGVLYNASLDPAWAAATQGRRPSDVNGGVINQMPITNGPNSGYSEDVFNIRGALEIDLSDRVSLSLGASVGESSATNKRDAEHVENITNAIQGLGGPNCDPRTGTPGEGGCEWYNPFLSQASPDAIAADPRLANSDELIAFLMPGDAAAYFFDSRLSSIDATFNIGTGWELAGGEVAVAAGADYRQEEATVNYNQNMLDGVLNGILPQTPSGGEDSVVGLFGEAALPLTDELTMQLALRYDNYDSVGSTTNPKVGFNYAPTDRVALRASFGTSFKSPTIRHLNPFTSATPLGDGVSPRRLLRDVSTINQAIPGLEPQTATHFSVGGDFVLLEDVGALNSLNFNVAYVSFEFDDRISPLDGQSRHVSPGEDGAATALCGTNDDTGARNEFYYFENNDPGGLPCFDGVDANMNGILEHGEVHSEYIFFSNLSTVDVKGLNLNLSANVQTPVGNLGLRVAATHMLTFDIARNSSEEPVSAVGVSAAGAIHPSVGNVYEWRINPSASMRWRGGGHATTLTGRNRSDIMRGDTVDYSYATEWQVRHNWSIRDNLDVGLTIRNLFGEVPIHGNATSPTVRPTDGIRLFFLNVSARL